MSLRASLPFAPVEAASQSGAPRDARDAPGAPATADPPPPADVTLGHMMVHPANTPDSASGHMPQSPARTQPTDTAPHASVAPGWPVRRPMVLGLTTLALLLGGFGGWAMLSSIAGAVIAPGQVEVVQNRQIVQHPDGGVVAEVLVSEGQKVPAGAPLLRLDGALLQSELAIIEGQFFETLARRGRLMAERDADNQPVINPELAAAAKTSPEVAALVDGQVRLLAARRESQDQLFVQLNRRAAQIESQIAGIEAQHAAMTLQQGFIAEELEAQRSLFERGLAHSARVLALQREEARLGGALGELTAERARAEAAITEIAIERLRLNSTRREEAEAALRDLDARALELAERRNALRDRIDQLELRAPVSGVVHGLQVTTPRAVLRPADPVLQLVPLNRPLVIAASVASTDISQVTTGQEARVMLRAFNMRTTPELRGHVTLLSADTFTDRNSGQGYYRAEITLAPGEIEKLDSRHLVPGMPADVFLQTGARSPLAYLVQPLGDYFSRALRER